MKQDKKLYKIFTIAVSVQTIIMGIFFIIQVLRIYYANNSIYTREICGEYLIQMLPIIIVWILLVVFSAFYFDTAKEKLPKITNIAKLSYFENICPDSNNSDCNSNNSDCNSNSDSEYILKNEQKKRKIALLICFIITIICSLMGLLYLLNGDHFASNDNLSWQAIELAIHLLPWCIIAFGSFIVYVYYEERSAKRSIEVIKEIIKTNGKSEKVKKENNKKINIVRISLFVVAIFLIVFGLINGDANGVLQKAINICTECIGLG